MYILSEDTVHLHVLIEVGSYLAKVDLLGEGGGGNI